MEITQNVELENILSIAKDIIKNYCIDNYVDDEYAIHPANWCDILDEIHQAVFSNNSNILKTETNLYNQYDLEKVIYLYNRVYVKLCNKYIQEICQKDFLILSGIDKQSLYNWSGNNKLSSSSFDFIEKINEDNEASLWALMKGDKGNPNKWFGKMNKYHGWNGSGTTSGHGDNKQQIGASGLKQLGLEMSVTDGKTAQIAQNNNA